jgi:hypothetical protein
MRIGERKMPKDASQLLSKPLLNCFYDRECRSTIGTFVVAVFDQGDAGGFRSLDMIASADL